MVAQTVLPFDFKRETMLTGKEELLAQISSELRTACEQCDFLFDYLQYVPIK